MSKWHNVVRLAHLPGGLRALNNPGPGVELIPSIDPAVSPVTFDLRTYASLGARLVALGLVPIGIDFYENQGKVDGRYPPTWRPSHPDLDQRYIAWEAEDVWRCLSNAGYEADDVSFFDLANRVSFQIRASVHRLRELSDAYHIELACCCSGGDFKDGVAFESLNSFKIFISVHSVLVDLCVLRDYLAEFLATFVFGSHLNNVRQVRSMSSLRKALAKVAETSDPLMEQTRRITDRTSSDSWMYQLGAYRDLSVHTVPLVDMVGRGVIRQCTHQVSSGYALPGIRFCLSQDPAAEMSRRSKSVPWANIEEWLQSSVQLAIEDSGGPDALQYCWSTLGQMMCFAADVARRSPLQPKRVSISDEDIKGPVQRIDL